ncbi:ABC transporter permease family protein [Goodfellowiella coeruleoviolacea]|uniref:Uncharacterized protein n=1 Tax=Goodfellowiella coeruleoviolacea TaxID=334858 RepID=A0AAE3GGI9_9PSEU|nr:hypothetical protein [Goodfellowiella coeruleoviolacea]MCP2167836.1 hypothetical protein [Goodfellowiella coeruleoviolacea]
MATGLSACNEFLFAVAFVRSGRRVPVPVSTAMFSFQQGFSQDYPLVSAAGLIMLLPMVFLFLQRRFIDGVAVSGLDGTTRQPPVDPQRTSVLRSGKAVFSLSSKGFLVIVGA